MTRVTFASSPVHLELHANPRRGHDVRHDARKYAQLMEESGRFGALEASIASGGLVLHVKHFFGTIEAAGN